MNELLFIETDKDISEFGLCLDFCHFESFFLQKSTVAKRYEQ